MLNTHTKLMASSEALAAVKELAQIKGVDILADKNNKIVARKEHTAILGWVLEDKSNRYFTQMIKLVIASEATKHMPLATVMAQFAVSIKMDSKLGFRVGGVVLNLLKQAGLMTEYLRTTENGFQERVIKLPSIWAINEETMKELLLKVSPGAKPFKPKDWIVKPDGTLQVGGYSTTKAVMGSRLNEKIVQEQALYDVLNHEQSTQYAVDWDVYNKFRHHFQDSFPAEQSWTEIVKLDAELDILGDKPAYFARCFGANGRVYILGYRTHREGGIRNEIFNFFNKKLWNKSEYYIVHQQIADLKGCTSAKEEIQLYVLQRDLALQQAGIPTGTIVRRDAKMSGVQVAGAVAMRSKKDGYHCGLLSTYEDGRLVIASQPKMTGYKFEKPQAKAAAMTWMYLSGGDAMINKVKEDTGMVIDCEGKQFKKDWDEAAEEVFPGQLRLMKEMMGILYYKKSNTHFRWTSSSGFKVSLAAIGTVATTIDTVMGKHEFSREEIDPEFMGVRLGAAFGHSEDAAVRHEMVKAAKFYGKDIDVVHDQFGVELNYSASNDQEYVNRLRYNLSQPILHNFMQDVAGNGARANSVIIGDLVADDIVSGLYN